MGLVIQIEAVGDQFLEINLRRALWTPVATGTIASCALTARPVVAATVAAWTTTPFRTRTTARPTASWTTILTRRTVSFAFFRFLLFCLSHLLFLSADEWGYYA
jgi:hypothetical protein